MYLIEKASLREFQGALLLVRQLMDWDPSRTTNAPPPPGGGGVCF